MKFKKETATRPTKVLHNKTNKNTVQNTYKLTEVKKKIIKTNKNRFESTHGQRIKVFLKVAQ